MSNTSILIQLLGGFTLLLLGAEILVRKAQRLSILLGVSPLLIGLTVVAYGTSAPELAVNINAIMDDPPRTELLIGNVVGSNIANILLVLGLSAIIYPIIIAKHLVRSTLLLMIAVSMLIYVFSSDGHISRLEGILLFLGSLAYTSYLIVSARKHSNQSTSNLKSRSTKKKIPLYGEATGHLIFIIIGLTIIVLGADQLVDASISLARELAVSEMVIGLTIIAVGTSLPELATSIIAGIRNHRDIAVGNVVGSNIFNILLVLGFCAAIAPDGVKVEPIALNFDIPLMVTISLMCLPIFISGYQITRWEGLLLFSYYIVYVWHLYQSQGLDRSDSIFTEPLIYWLLPLLVIAAFSMLVQLGKILNYNRRN